MNLILPLFVFMSFSLLSSRMRHSKKKKEEGKEQLGGKRWFHFKGRGEGEKNEHRGKERKKERNLVATQTEEKKHRQKKKKNRSNYSGLSQSLTFHTL